MATARPFTYNNGPLISGSTQIGDLAIGSASLDYSSQPGGKVWWMGPDEDNKYIVAKDVPSQNYPTPVGNVGSVKFWATSGQTDNLFIALTNNIGGNSFSNTSVSWQWLTLNGYWTNFPQPSNTFERAQFKVYKNESNPTNFGANRIDYSSNQDTVYFYRTATGATETWGNNGIAFYSNVSSVFLGDSISVSGSGAYLPTVTNSDGNTRGRGTFTIDDGNNRLYVNAGDTAIQYNITNNTAVANVKLTGVSNTYNNAYKPAHVNSENKLFIPQLDTIRIVDTTTMTYDTADDIDVLTDYSKNMALAIADNSNNRVLCGGEGYFIIIDASDNSVAYSSSVNGGVSTNSYQEPGFGVHVPSENAYFMNASKFVGPFAGDYVPYILRIEDSFPYSQSLYSLDNTSGGTPLNTYTAISYDSINNYIWAMNTERDICYLDIDTGIVTHTDTVFRGTGAAIAPYVTSNSGLWIGTNTVNNTVKMYDTRLILSYQE